jgi:hypothetical protein
MKELQKLEERLRKEGLQHSVYEESYGETLLHVLSYPNSTRPIVSFIFERGKPMRMYFGPMPFAMDDLKAYSHHCRDEYQAHAIIIGLFNAFNS